VRSELLVLVVFAGLFYFLTRGARSDAADRALYDASGGYYL